MGIQLNESGANTPGPESPPRARGVLRFAWIIGLLAFAIALYYVGIGDFLAAMRGADPKWCVATALALLAGQWIRAWKWWVVLGRGEHAVGVHFLSKLGGNYTPGRVGEFAPLLVARHRSHKLAAWIAADRLLEMLCTLVLGIGGIAALGLAQGPGFLLVSGVMAVACAGLLVFFRHETWVHTALRLIPRLPRGEWIREMIVSVHEAYRGLQSRMPVAAGITVVASLVDLAGGWALFMAFGYPLPVAILAGVKCLYAVVAAIPWAPAATGLPMLSAAAVWHQAVGVPEATIAAAIALNFALTQIVFWSSFWIGTAGLAAKAVEAD